MKKQRDDEPKAYDEKQAFLDGRDVSHISRTHHSNEDVFDRIQSEDLKEAATIMAAFAYNAAMMDERFSRKPLD